MKKTVKKNWLNALRTGVLSDGRKVKQGKNTLKRNGKFCCLAVLAEEAVIAGVIEPPVRKSVHGDRGWYYGPSDIDNNSLPAAVQKWAGLDGPDPYVSQCSLSQANDYFDKSFVEIADMIDEDL